MKTLEARAAGELHRGAGIAGSLALHLALVASVVIAARQPPRPSLLPAYRVELVAAPLATTPAAEAAPPTAAPPAPTANRQPPTANRQPPTANRRPPTANRQPVSGQRSAVSGQPSAPASQPPAPSPNTASAPGTGADAATIRTEGVEFPFPGYLRNLVAQVYRRWRPPAGNVDLEAEMIFFVHRDGSMTGLQFVRRSGSFAFDLEAQGAVEAAARAGAFGALPAGFGPDLLPVSFFFSPRSLR